MQSKRTESKIPIGTFGLDQILAGGLPAAHVYLLEGTPGTGKTTLALQFVLEGIRLGEKCLYIALSESMNELAGVAQSHGWTLDRSRVFELCPKEAGARPEDEYTVFHADEVEMAETIQIILSRIDEEKPTRIVIDSLAELRLLSIDAIRYRRQLLALKQALTSKQVTVLLLDDRTSHDVDFQVHSLVHGVIALERVSRDYGKDRRRLQVVKLRGSTFMEGYHDYIIQKGGLTVFPRMSSDREISCESREKIGSGMAGLDEMLGGGLERGTTTLITGPSGAGKTSLCLKYCVAGVGRAEPVGIYTFDETVTGVVSRGEELGMPIRRYVDEGKITVDQVNPAELSPGEFAARVRKSVEEANTQMVVIDSLNGYMKSMPQEEYLNLQLHELLFFLNQRGVVTIVIVAQQGIFGSEQAGIDLSYLADSIVLLRFFEAAGRVRRAISILKKRFSKHEQTIREFTIGLPESVRIGEPLDTFQGILSGIPQFIGDPKDLSSRSQD